MEKDKQVTLTMTVDDIREGLLPLYEFYLFDYIRNDPDIDSPKWLRNQTKIYSTLLQAVGEDERWQRY